MTCTPIIIGDACVHLGTLSDEIPRDINGPLAVLLPASDKKECEAGLAMIPALLANHCNQISCVGLFAEKLHDQIDDMLEDLRRPDVITTFHTDALEAAEYFIFAARVSAPTLLALVGNHPDIVDALSQAESSP